MGKVSKKLRLRKKYNYDVNRKNLWRTKNKKANITDVNVKEAWDNSASMRVNLAQMGIASDPNKVIRMPSRFPGAGDASSDRKPTIRTKTFVIDKLAEVASIKAEGTFKLSEPEVLFCIYMIEKYQDDFKAMARDKTNYYQETPKQIRRKIRVFESIPLQYNDYLEKKAAGLIDADKLVQKKKVATKKVVPKKKVALMKKVTSKTRLPRGT